MLARRNFASSFLPITSLQTQWFHAITHSFAQRRDTISPILNSFRTLLPLTVISFFVSHFHAFVRFLSRIQPQVSNFQSLAASCASLYPLFRTPIICFQQLAASFCKIPGVGVGVPGFLFDFQLSTVNPPRVPIHAEFGLFSVPRCLCGQTFRDVRTFRHSELQTFSARMLVIP